ncbi:YniB family protein [Enterobacteriaceae bacterium LUAb1]
MTLQQAGRVAVIRRICGWIFFMVALLSTLVSLLGFLYNNSQKQPGMNAVLVDFIHVVVDMIKLNTPFLDLLWRHSPVPDFNNGYNVSFWIIYFLMFVGIALTASGARISRQVHYVKEGIEDQLILEQLKDHDGRSRKVLEEKIVVPRHSVLLQIFPLYFLPLLIIVFSYFLLKLIGFIH